MIANYFQEKLMFQEQCELSLRAIDRALGLHSFYARWHVWLTFAGQRVVSPDQPVGQYQAVPVAARLAKTALLPALKGGR